MDNLEKLFYRPRIDQLNDIELNVLLNNALQIDHNLAIKILFYIRNPKFGKGERRIGRRGFDYIAKHYPKLFLKFFHRIPEIGRWDDLLYITNISLFPFIDKLIQIQLEQDYMNMMLGKNISSCCKWLPSEGHSFFHNHFHRFIELLDNLKLSRPEYRRKLSLLRQYYKTHNVKKTYPINEIMLQFELGDKSAESMWMEYCKSTKTEEPCIDVCCEISNSTHKNHILINGLQLVSNYNRTLKDTISYMYYPTTCNLKRKLEECLFYNQVPKMLILVTDCPFQRIYKDIVGFKEQFMFLNIQLPTIVIWNIISKKIEMREMFGCVYVSGNALPIVQHLTKKPNDQTIFEHFMNF